MKRNIICIYWYMYLYVKIKFQFLKVWTKPKLIHSIKTCEKKLSHAVCCILEDSYSPKLLDIRVIAPLSLKTNGNAGELPVRVFSISCGLSGNGIFKYLSSVNLLLYCTTSDHPIYNHVLFLANPKSSVYCLGISGWVPTWIILKFIVNKIHCT